MSELMTWEQLEQAHLAIANSMKEIENKLIQEDIEEEDFKSLSFQLEQIQKTVMEFKAVEEEFLKDRI